MLKNTFSISTKLNKSVKHIRKINLRFQNKLFSLNEPKNKRQFPLKQNPIFQIDNQDYSIFTKIISTNTYEQNLALTHRILDILKSDYVSSLNTFIAVNEIHKTNLNNNKELLQIFLSQILKYNDSIRLFIQRRENKYEKLIYLLPISLVIIWMIGIIYLYFLYEKFFINYDSIFESLIQNYKDDINSRFQIHNRPLAYENHENVNNCINFAEAKNFVLIGPSSLGKTESIKNFCLLESQKDKLIIYIDLDEIESTKNGKKLLIDLIKDRIIESYLGKTISNFKADLLTTDTFSIRLWEYLQDKKVNFIFDNYNHERDSEIVFHNSIPIIKKNSKWQSAIVTNNNELYKNAIQNNLEIKNINFFTPNENFKKYLFNKLNTYCKDKGEFSNLELFNEENLKSYHEVFRYFSFDELLNYLKTNDSLKSFMLKKDKKLIKKLRLLEAKDSQTYEFLKILVKLSITNKSFNWINLPTNSSFEQIITLEKFGLIFTRDFEQFIILNSKIKDHI